MKLEEEWVVESLGEFLNDLLRGGVLWGSLEGAFTFPTKEIAEEHIRARAFAGPPDDYRAVDMKTAIIIEAMSS